MHTTIHSWHLILSCPFRLRANAPQASIDSLLESTLRGSPWHELSDPLLRGRDPAGVDAEYTYFHPFVRRLLYETDPVRRTFRVFRRKAEDCRYVWITRPQQGHTIAKLEVQDILLHVVSQQGFPAGTAAFLKIELTSTEPMRLEDLLDTSAFLRYITRPRKDPPRMVRICFGPDTDTPPSPVQQTAPTSPRKPYIHHHWQQILAPIGCAQSQDDERLWVEMLGDIRMGTMSHFTLDDPFSIKPDDWARIASVSNHSFPAYAEEFSARELSDGCLYDRWWDRANAQRYVMGPMQFAFVSRPSAGERWVDYYYPLYFIAHFQRAMLLILQDEIAEVSLMPSGEQFHARMPALEQSAAVFESAYWFQEVTPQIQGQELFQLIRRQIALEQLHASVMGDKSVLTAWAADITQRSRDEFRETVEKLIPLGLAMSLLGINVCIEPVRQQVLVWGQMINDAWKWSWSSCKLCGLFLAELWIVLFALFLFYMPYFLLVRNSRRRRALQHVNGKLGGG